MVALEASWRRGHVGPSQGLLLFLRADLAEALRLRRSWAHLGHGALRHPTGLHDVALRTHGPRSIDQPRVASAHVCARRRGAMVRS